jgi:hypothetical protein
VDEFLAKSSAEGELVWSTELNANAFGPPTDVDVAPNGDVVVLTTAVVVPDPSDPVGPRNLRVLARYASNGDPVFRIEEPAGPYDNSRAIAVDARGELWVLGANFADTEGDVTVDQYDSSGQRLRTHAADLPGDDRATDIALTSNGGAVVIGLTYGETSFLLRF